MIAAAIILVAALFLFTVAPRVIGAVVGLVVGWLTKDRRPP